MLTFCCNKAKHVDAAFAENTMLQPVVPSTVKTNFEISINENVLNKLKTKVVQIVDNSKIISNTVKHELLTMLMNSGKVKSMQFVVKRQMKYEYAKMQLIIPIEVLDMQTINTIDNMTLQFDEVIVCKPVCDDKMYAITIMNGAKHDEEVITNGLELIAFQKCVNVSSEVLNACTKYVNSYLESLL